MAPSPPTAAAATTSVVCTNSPSTKTPPTSKDASPASFAARDPSTSRSAQKVFDGMLCKPAASVLHITMAEYTTDKNDYMRGFLHVRDHRIGKISMKRVKHIKRKLAASSPPTAAPDHARCCSDHWAGRTANGTSANPCPGFIKC
ncbi:hypothetical protein PVAP13_2KG474300 [Panicum virgatum]|uniref:Uncharacterized protein n=1 Tax=Panicum virgatum TaxID=38727 RepID=A0A8T0WLG3_PANVG|nr:hypothetical protein PVAP13_2KG474300 [Panicum virgatum]